MHIVGVVIKYKVDLQDLYKIEWQ